MSAIDFLKKLPAAFDASGAAGTEAIVQFNISKPAHIIIKGGSCSLVEGSAANADVSLTMEDDDLVALLKGDLNGMTAFMTGKLQLDGDMMLAQRMTSFFDASKLG